MRGASQANLHETAALAEWEERKRREAAQAHRARAAAAAAAGGPAVAAALKTLRPRIDKEVPDAGWNPRGAVEELWRSPETGPREPRESRGGGLAALAG